VINKKILAAQLERHVACKAGTASIQIEYSAPRARLPAHGGPDSNCDCPNAAASSCFACSNVCRLFNAAICCVGARTSSVVLHTTLYPAPVRVHAFRLLRLFLINTHNKEKYNIYEINLL
jgi:hypothetical protein